MSPTITAAKSTDSVNETNSKDLACTGTARPAPTMTWSKGSTSIVAGGRYKVTEGQPQLNSTTGLTMVQSVLQISNTNDSDRGQYTCTATSPKTVVPKTAATTVELVVNGRCAIKITVLQPRFSLHNGQFPSSFCNTNRRSYYLGQERTILLMHKIRIL